jgi:hypothetical protein
MAKKATKAVKNAVKRKGTSKSVKRDNVKILVDAGALDPGAAARLERSVIRKINRYTTRDVNFLINHQLKVCGVARPAPDGSFF